MSAWLSQIVPGKDFKWKTVRNESEIEELEDGEPTDSLLHEKLLRHKMGYERRKSLSKQLWWFCSLLLKTFFFGSWIFLALCLWMHRKDSSCLLGNERIFDDIPIRHEMKRFQRAGFHDDRHNDLTEYEGAPNAKNNAAWEKLLAVGVVGISSHEDSKLPNGTALSVTNPSVHIVELEMFHQLHCLKWLRDRYWELEGVVESSMDVPQRQAHSDHCIDYLRQVIMCHGDITPISFEWNNGIDAYLAHHSTPHMCRNFNSIYEWAAKRDNTGLRADGNHKNVDLEEHEMFD
ncbi:hypothetical protein BDV27DRAFT_152794 [Aspergillus caelatus]|uniref:Tat pathway signal sequence n=1 Tax=Aspergillus caelatus TaxID=61420 RepID=A0A5N7AJ73_9EURO|nr:uncharacterized protein BDV27DRAFT_152794 [Aspergillus caelatus]KAE8369713.1 hypothetical protein BDV27DRAFT_152794 [Aspergillus caelatus]